MSIEHLGVRNRLMASGAAVAVAAGLFGALPRSTDAEPATSKGTDQCFQYPSPSKNNNHEREVCFAYIGNSAGVALGGFYRFGNNRIAFWANQSRRHFETRYFGDPRVMIENRVDSWSKTDDLLGNQVVEEVNLYGPRPIVSNLQADRAVLRTIENYDVYGSGGVQIYHESRHVQNIIMCRGKLSEGSGIFGVHFLHSWFVVKFNHDPNFDCIAFDRAHGIKP